MNAKAFVDHLTSLPSAAIAPRRTAHDVPGDDLDEDLDDVPPRC